MTITVLLHEMRAMYVGILFFWVMQQTKGFYLLTIFSLVVEEMFTKATISLHAVTVPRLSLSGMVIPLND